MIHFTPLHNGHDSLCVANKRSKRQKGLYREWYAVLNGAVRNRKQEISEAKFLPTVAVGVFATRRPKINVQVKALITTN